MAVEEQRRRNLLTIVPGRAAPARPANTPARPTPGLPDDFWQVDEEAILHPPADRCYEVSLDTFFNARHSVTLEGLTGSVHAHSYRLQVRYRTHSLTPEAQIVVGYQALRERTDLVIQAYNNRLLNDLPAFRRLQPTTENLAGVLYQQLGQAVRDLPVQLVAVTVWESPTKAITYGEG